MCNLYVGSAAEALNSQTSPMRIWNKHSEHAHKIKTDQGHDSTASRNKKDDNLKWAHSVLYEVTCKLFKSQIIDNLSIGLICSIHVPVQEEGLFQSHHELCHTGKDFSAFWYKGRYNLKQENKQKCDHLISITCSLISRWLLHCWWSL